MRAISLLLHFMTDLGERLELLGLSQYFDPLVSEGFDTWETLLDITESDLTYLNFKLGHRRKLQRAIAESRGQPADRALVTKLPVTDGAYRSDESGTERRDLRSPGHSSTQTGGSNAGTKRKYRRHPKPDANGPERPPSAYVIFSNQVREDLKGQELSFTEIAKVVGERWQVLPADVRENYEQQANSAKERYYSAMSEYKKTPEYAQYQAYLAEFKAKHGLSRADGKRSKVETETSSASEPLIGMRDSAERMTGTKSAPQLSAGVQRSSASSPAGVAGSIYGAAQRRLSPSASSAVWSEPMNSPQRPDLHSPEHSPIAMAQSLSARDQRVATRRTAAQPSAQDTMYTGSQQPVISHRSRYRPSDVWSGTENTTSYFTVPPPRDARAAIMVPELTRQESTLSSAASSQNQTSPLHVLPPLDVAKVLDRRLPQPVSIVGGRPSSLEHRGPLPAPLAMTNTGPSGQFMHARHASGGSSEQRSGWPALLQATNLAREAEKPDSTSINDHKEPRSAPP